MYIISISFLNSITHFSDLRYTIDLNYLYIIHEEVILIAEPTKDSRANILIMADLFYQYVDRRVLSLANTRQCTGHASFICATFWGNH
jgi:hypothetical protein